jgi:K+-transporting ATPase ATPase A chain
MTIAGFTEIAVTLALVLAAAVPLGRLMADVFEGRRTFLHPVLSLVERAVYRLAGIDPQRG